HVEESRQSDGVELTEFPAPPAARRSLPGDAAGDMRIRGEELDEEVFPGGRRQEIPEPGDIENRDALTGTDPFLDVARRVELCCRPVHRRRERQEGRRTHEGAV